VLGVTARMLRGWYEYATRKLFPWNLSISKQFTDEFQAHAKHRQSYHAARDLARNEKEYTIINSYAYEYR